MHVRVLFDCTTLLFYIKIGATQKKILYNYWFTSTLASNKAQIRVVAKQMPSDKRKRQAAVAIQARWSKTNGKHKVITY